MDTKNIVTAKAHANIAIIKYWGKLDEVKKTPLNSSISLTLDKFYTITSIERNTNLNHDVFYLNDELQSDDETLKISKILDYFRTTNEKVIVRSHNSMPTAAGLSSSSSGYAALVLCANKAFNSNKSHSELSYIARLGSGSACRSLYGPVAIWRHDNDEHKAIAYPLQCNIKLAMIIIILNKNKKKVLSRDGMRHCVETSTIFDKWVTTANNDALKMVDLLQTDNFKAIGELMERNTLLMHETTLHANPPFSYLNSDTHECLDYIKKMRQDGFEAYFTMDAGPNVKLLCKATDVHKIYKKLQEKYDADNLVMSHLVEVNND